MTKIEQGAPEWLRDLRGLPAYLVAFYTPIEKVSFAAYLWLLPYAGDWMFRDTRRELALEQANQK